MSDFRPSQVKHEATGIIFGEARTMHNENISVFVRSENSVCFNLLVGMFRATLLLKLKPSELIKLRDALTKAIDWDKERSTACNCGNSTCNGSEYK